MPYKDKEKEREYKRKWREANQERINQYRQEHHEEILKRKHEYDEANRDRINEKARRHYQDNREKCIESVLRSRRNRLNHCVYLLELPDCRMYVGSTSDYDQRLVKHKQALRRHPDRLLYRAIAELGGWDQVKVHVLMRDVPDKILRRKLEQHFLDMIPESLRLNELEVINENASETTKQEVLDGSLGNGNAHLCTGCQS